MDYSKVESICVHFPSMGDSFQQWFKKSCTSLVSIDKEFSTAPNNTDHSLHHPILISAISFISPYLEIPDMICKQGKCNDQQPLTSKICHLFFENPYRCFATVINLIIIHPSHNIVFEPMQGQHQRIFFCFIMDITAICVIAGFPLHPHHYFIWD